MKKLHLLSACFAVLFTLISTSTDAALIYNGGGLIYDDVLDITWAQPDDVNRSWSFANTWAAGLTLGGVSGWRQPYISVAAGAGPFTGSPVDCSTATEVACRDNELGYMFHHNLGGTASSALFPTLHPSWYWSGTEFDPSAAWIFHFVSGTQASVNQGSGLRTWAVHAGNVSPIHPPGDTGPFNAQEYFPLHPGNQSTYLVNDSVSHTATVPDYTVNVNGVPTRPIQVFPGVTEYWTNDGNGIRVHQEDLSNGEIAVFNPPITITAPQFSVGDIYNTNGIQTQTVPGLGVFDLDFSATSSILAEEPVSVPLGIFPAIRVAVTVHTTGVVLGTPVDLTTTITNWAAQHYGPVWRIDNDPDFGIVDGKLTAVSIDTDEDGVNVTDDNCPGISNPLQTNSDTDGNGDACDNCTLIANGDQRDSDADNIGNMCDCDFNQDNFCGGPDFTQFIGCFNAATGGDPICEAADMNGDNFVGGPDFTLFIGGFNGPPGPTGLAP